MSRIQRPTRVGWPWLWDR